MLPLAVCDNTYRDPVSHQVKHDKRDQWIVPPERQRERERGRERDRDE